MILNHPAELPLPISSIGDEELLQKQAYGTAHAPSALELLRLGDLWQVCFSFLDVHSVVTLELVCQVFKRYARSSLLWRQMYERDYRSSKPLSGLRQYSSDSVKNMYFQRRKNSRIRVSTLAKAVRLANGTILVENVAGEEHVARFGRSTTSIRGETALRPFCFSGEPVVYFEAKVNKRGWSIGVSALDIPVLRTAYGAQSDRQTHVGLRGISYGLYCNDGVVYWNDRMASTSGHTTAFLPLEEEGISVNCIGCGFNVFKRRLFFTLDGEFWEVPGLNVRDVSEFAFAFALQDAGDTAVLNLGSGPFCYDIEAHNVEAQSA